MKHVVLDFEMNPIDKKYREARRICKMEIIQIGAVVLDDDYVEIGRFSTLVKPQYNNVIEASYQQLTHISTYMVRNAPVFEQALDSFLKWIDHLQDEIEILAWSENDLEQLVLEAELKEYVFCDKEENWLNNWFDFQEEFDEKMKLEYQCSLIEALMLTGIELEGNMHDALCDAHNTASLVSYLRDETRCSHSFRSCLDNHTSSGCTLGDLFDFASFDFS